MKRLVFILVLCSVGFFAAAQLLPYSRYTSRDGLIADRITAIAQDERGVMWFGSYFGIGIYDGVEFQKIKLPFEQQNKFVTSIVPVGKKVYAGFLFEGGLAEFSEGRVIAHSLKLQGSRDNGVTAIGKFDDTSIMVANNSNDILHFANGKFSYLFSLPHPSIPIREMIRDGSNNIWVSTQNGLWIRNAKNKLISFFPDQNVFSVTRPASGGFLIAASGEMGTTIYKCDGFVDDSLVNLSELVEGKQLYVVSFRGSVENGFWAIEQNGTLVNIRPDGKLNYYQSVLDMQAETNVIFSDRENNLWIGNDPGLIRISNFSSVFWHFDELAAGGGHIMKWKDDELLVSNSKSIYKIKDDSIKKIQFKPDLSGYFGKMIEDTQSYIWIVRWDEGIWRNRLNKESFTGSQYFSVVPKGKVSGGVLLKDGLGNIWAGGADGLFRFRNGKIMERYFPTTQAGEKLFLTNVAVDTLNQWIWMGDNARGIIKAKYSIADDGEYSYKIEKYYAQNEGLKDPHIRSMLLDHSGILWLGTRSGGVYRMQTNSNNSIIESFGPPGGFTCARITSIIEENKKAIWFASCDGVYRYTYANKQWSHFNVSDGLLSSEVFSLWVDAENKKLWAMTEQGVTRIDLNYSRTGMPAPIVHLTEVSVLGKPDSASLYQQGRHRFPSNQNSIGFVFAAGSFINEKKNQYRYMLEGYDDHWSNPVNTNSVNYASLPPGDYNFKVIASNAMGVWSKEPASFQFRITIPFYQRPWFIFTCIAIAALLFYLFRVQRLKQRYEVEKLRLRIARDLHDDIGSALGSINLMSETANRKLSKTAPNEDVAVAFRKISHFAHTTLESMDDIIWSINPDKDKVGDLLLRMREFVIPLLEENNIEFDFKAEADNSSKLPMILRRNLFLIFKEAIFNIAKHSGCSRVIINLEINNKQLLLNVHDNGKGFDPSTPTQRNGLKNVRERASLLGGELKISSSKEQGTKIAFKCPIR